MLSKEEIEKAKQTIYPLSIGDFITWFTTDGCVKVEIATTTLLEYINYLESRQQKLIEKLEERIRYFEENDELIATSNDNYSDGTVIKRFIDEFKEILEILKN